MSVGSTGGAESWRSLLNPKENAAYERGDYNSVAFAPRESELVSRSSKEETITEWTIDRSANPEQEAYRREFEDAVETINTIRTTCGGCESPLGEQRVTMLRTDLDDAPPAIAFCPACFARYNVPVKTFNWVDALDPIDKKIWELHTSGHDQEAIAKRVGKHRATISRKLSKMKKRR